MRLSLARQRVRNCFLIPQGPEIETALLPKKKCQDNHLLCPPKRPFDELAKGHNSLNAWVAFERQHAPNSQTQEALRRIYVAQLGETKELDLKGLNLSSVPPLNGCEQLEVYSLESNRLRRIPNNLGNLPNLRKIVLNGNLLREVPAFCQYEKLRYVGLSFNPLRRVPKDLRRHGVWVHANYTLLTFDDWIYYLEYRYDKNLRNFLTWLDPGAVRVWLPPVNTFSPEYPKNWHRL